PGASDQPIEYRVERVRDGRLFSSRTVDAVQNDKLIWRTLVSCSVDDYGGVGHSRQRPCISPPESALTIQQIAESDGGLGEYWDGFSSVEVRIAEVSESDVTLRSAAPERHLWLRVTEDLSDDRALHQAAVAYVSDLMMIGASVTPHGYTIGHENTLAKDWLAVSLDHSMWFHRHVRADEWILFELSTPTAAKGRAAIESSVFDGDTQTSHEQAVHVVQEAFLRRTTH
ncbi:MAG: acyl-CoA thioesterase II, partial [Leucobacter sp.]|nr:acyl-CoA thioesterase II [Leucobacter sp.]